MMRRIDSPVPALAVGLALLLAGMGAAPAVVEPRWAADFAYSAPLKGRYTAVAADRDGRFLHAVFRGASRAAPGQSRLLLVRGTDGANVGDGSADFGGTPWIQSIEPCAAGGWVFAGTTFAPNRLPARVAGRVASTGTVQWLRELGVAPGLGDLSTAPRVVPTPDCGVVVLDSVSPGLPGTGQRLAVLDAADGEPRWTLVLRSGATAALDGLDPTQAFAVATDALFVALQRRADRAVVLARFDLASGRLDAIAPTGETLPASPRALALAAGGGHVWLATTAIDPESSLNLPVVVALRTTDATVDWRYSAPAVAEGAVYAVDLDAEHEITARFDGRLVRLQRSTGVAQWSVQRGRIRSFAVSDAGEVALVSAGPGDMQARVERLRADTGAARWSVDEATLGFRPKVVAIGDAAGPVALIGEDLSGAGGEAVAADRGVLLDGATGAALFAIPYAGRAPTTQPQGLVLGDGSVAVVTAGWGEQGRAVLSIERKDAATGEPQWQTAIPFATPVRADELELAAPTLSDDGVLGVAATAGIGTDSLEQISLAATIDVATGEIIWQRAFPPEGPALWPESIAVLRVDGTQAGDATLGLRGYVPPQIEPFPSTPRFWVRFARGDGTSQDLADSGRSILLAARSGTTALLRERDGAAIEHLRAVDVTDGTTRWTRPAGLPGDLAAQLVVRAGHATALFTRPRPPGSATDAAMQSFDLSTGTVLWERVYPETRPVLVTPVALKSLANGDWAFSVQRAAGGEGLSIRRVDGATGVPRWQRELPMVVGTSASGGGLVEWGDGRLAVSATTSWSAPQGRCRVCTNRLVMLDGTTGGISGWHATFGAQAPGANGALDAPRVLPSSVAGPVALSWAAVEPAQGPQARLAVLDPPAAGSGALSLRLLSVDRAEVDAGQLRVSIEASHDGSLSGVRAVVRAGAGSGVAVRGEACVPGAGASCGATGVAPMWLQAIELAAGSTVRLDVIARVPAWVDEPGALVMMLEGDYRIADVGPGEQVLIVPLPTVLLRDSFE